MRRLLVFCRILMAFWLAVSVAHGQTRRAVYQMKLDATREPDFVVTETNGCLLGWYPERTMGKATAPIRIKGLDTAMRPQWEGFYQIKPDYDLRYSEQDFAGNAVWLIFLDRVRMGNALFLKINYKDGTYESRTVTFPFVPEIQTILAARDGLYFQGSYQDKYMIAFSSFDENHVRVLPFISIKNLNLCGAGLDTSGTELSVVTSVKTGYREERSVLRSYRNGYFVGEARTIAGPKSRRQPYFLFRSRFQDSAWSGTWTSPTYDFPQGLCEITGTSIRFVEHLADDSAYLALFSAAKRHRLRLLKEGEPKDRALKYRYFSHPVPRPGGSVLMMESFSERSLNTYSMPGINNGNVGPGLRVYYYDHLLLARFDANGRLEGTTALSLPDISSPELEAQAALAGDTLLLIRKGPACYQANPFRVKEGWSEYPPVLLGLAEDARPEIQGVVQEGAAVYIWGKMNGGSDMFFISRISE